MAAVSVANTIPTDPATVAREKILQDYRKKLLEHKELEARLKESKFLFRSLVMHLQPSLFDSVIWKSSSHDGLICGLVCMLAFSCVIDFVPLTWKWCDIARNRVGTVIGIWRCKTEEVTPPPTYRISRSRLLLTLSSLILLLTLIMSSLFILVLVPVMLTLGPSSRG